MNSLLASWVSWWEMKKTCHYFSHVTSCIGVNLLWDRVCKSLRIFNEPFFNVYMSRRSLVLGGYALIRQATSIKGIVLSITCRSCMYYYTFELILRDHPYITSEYFWTFSDPPRPPYVSINSTEHQQKLPLFWPHPPSPFADANVGMVPYLSPIDLRPVLVSGNFQCQDK